MRVQDKEGIIVKDRSFFSSFKTKTVASLKENPEALCWNPSGNYFLISATQMIEINVEKLFSHSHKRVFSSKHTNNNNKIKFINEESFVTMNEEKVKLWDRREKSENNGVTIYMGKEKYNLLDVELFDKVDSEILLLKDDNLIHVYDIRKGASIKTVEPKISADCLLWSQKHSLLFCGGASLTRECFPGELALFDSNYSPIRTFNLHGESITNLKASPDFSFLATVSNDSTLQLHSFPDMLNLRTYSLNNEGIPFCIDFNYNDEFLSVGCGKRISIFNAKRGGQSFRIECRMNQRSVVWSPKKNILAYSDSEKHNESNKTYNIYFLSS